MNSPSRAGSENSLTISDRKRLQKLESIINEGLLTFIRVGSALREIRDRRLYRDTHSSFDSYCRERFGIGRHYAYRQIRGAQVTRLLGDVDSCQHLDRLPANEAQARPLTSLAPEEAREAWSLAIDLADGEQPTSVEVQEAVDLIAEGEEEADADDAGESIHFSSVDDEWLTPSSVVSRVEEVLGEISLDPCAASHASPAVPAEARFTEAEDGLAHAWSGTVYMNPPYGRGIDRWVEKLVEEYEDGAVSKAVALLPARTDTRWFRRLRPYPRCFLHGRLTFSGHDNSAPFPSMTVFLGRRPEKFIDVFSAVGDVYVAVDDA